MSSHYARLVRPLSIFIGGQPWMSKHNSKIVAVDRSLQRLTRGEVNLLSLGGLTGLMLTVNGVKSGIARSTPLLCVPYGDAWLIAGSNWGGPKQPVWVGNVATASKASVNFNGRDHVVVPREVFGEERDEMWAVMNQTWPNYAKYEKRTERKIRVFCLEPVTA